MGSATTPAPSEAGASPPRDSAARKPRRRGAAASAVRPLRLILLLGLLALQVAVCFHRLETASWQPDEPVYAHAGAAYLTGDLSPNREHPPLGKYLMGVPQVLLGEGLDTSRLAPATVGVVTGVALFLLLRVGAGFLPAVLGWSGWVLLPRSVGLADAGTHVDLARLERFSYLDVFAAGFMVLALLAGWHWARRGATGWAVATGVFGGLATASKLSGATVLIVTAAAALLMWRSPRALRQAVMAGLVAVGVFAVSYLPYGAGAPGALRYMFSVQMQHAASGHPVFTQGQMYVEPPWWVFLAYQVEADGGALTAVTLVAVCAALVLGRGRFRWYLLAAVVVPLIVLTLSPVVLRHYRFIVLPAQTGLVALGFTALLRSPAGRVLAALLAVPFVAAAAADMERLADLQPADYRVLAETLIRADRPEPRVVLRGYEQILREYLPGARILDHSGELEALDAIVLDPTSTLRWPVPELHEAGRARGMTRVEMGRLSVYLDPAVARQLSGSATGRHPTRAPPSTR